jgi:NADH-quinone oxidoreductase subunit A
MFYTTEYFNLIFICLIAILLALVLYFLTFYLNPKHETKEKVSIYECGFDPFVDSRLKFDVKFYLVSLLFILFDLEVMFLFPWALLVVKDFFWFSIGVIFLGILTVGFIYEWKQGALNWAGK